MAGAPLGNQNGRKRNRLVSDALKRELTQRPEDVLEIVNKLIADAKAGDHAARSLLFDRVDGKAPQPIVGDDEEAPITVREILIRAIGTADDRPAEEGG